MVHRRDGEVGPAHAAPREAEPLEGLGRGDLVDEMQVDVDERRLARHVADDVAVPDLLEQRAPHQPMVRGGFGLEWGVRSVRPE